MNKIQTLSGYFHEYQKSVTQPEEFWNRIDGSPYSSEIKQNAAIALVKMAEKLDIA